MARPTTRDELLSGAQARYQALMDTIKGLDAQALSAPFDFPATPAFKEAHWQRDQNLRDVLIHLYEWHQLLLGWAAANLRASLSPSCPRPTAGKAMAI